MKSLIITFFDYCSTVYNDLSDELGNKLQRSFNYAVRYIFDARKDEHITPYFRELDWLKLDERRTYFLLILVYKLLILNTGPSYLRNSFTLLSSVHNRNTRSHNYTLQLPGSRTVMFHSSFVATASRLWNSLPQEIVFSKSLRSFKRSLYTHLRG